MHEYGKPKHNPDIANTFFRAGFIESWGRGIEKICTLCKNYGIPEPEYTVHPGDIMLKFLAAKEAEDKKVTGKVAEKVTGKVTEKQMIILKEMENNPFVTAQQLSEILSISLRKTKENITKLKDKGIIRRVGPDKGGHWEIIKED